ncbi:MAG: RraA family protein [Rhizobiaceae bacterium]
MFQIGDMPEPLPDDLSALLQKVETATIGHVLHDGFMHPSIKPVLPGKRVVGCAVTVRIPAMDSVMLHHAVSVGRPGDFIVVERCGDTRHACWGGMVTHAASIAGMAGGVVDGPITDLHDFQTSGFAMWASGVSPITTKQLGISGALNVAVTVGGQVVCPGDIVLADDSGVVVLKRDGAETLARKAIAMQEFEIEVLQRMRAGEKIGSISGASEKIRQAMAASGS